MLAEVLGPVEIGVLGIGLLLVLLMSGVHIGVAFLLVSVLGNIAIMGVDPALSVLGVAPAALLGTFSFAVIPLFVLMGLLAGYSGITDDLYRAVRVWVGRLPGSLAMATAGAQAAFGACSGSSLASAVTFSKVSLPPMLAAGYDKKLALGTIGAAGTLAAMIPPSAIIVTYAIIAEQPVGPLLLAGFIPGIFSGLMYMGNIFLRVKLNPSLAPTTHENFTWKERFVALKGIWGLLVLVGAVTGSIYAGIATPTEAAALGALGAFLLAASRRQLGGGKLSHSLLESFTTSATVGLVIVSAMLFSRFLAVTTLPMAIMQMAAQASLPPLAVVAGFIVINLILGCFMETISIFALTLPIMLPTIGALGLDAIWFGILLIKATEVGLITPPLGMVGFAVQSAVSDKATMEEVFRGLLPFVITDLITIAILALIPDLVLFLPNTMHR